MVCYNTFQLPFFFGDLEELHVHGSKCNKAIHHNIPLLTQSMGTIHRLNILLWIPVRVVQNDCVGCTQIDSQSSRTSRQQEDRNVLSRLEVFDLLVSVALQRRAMNGTVFIPTE